MGEAILIASGKGGVGKTVFTANLGAALAQKGASVVLLDMSVGLRSLDICLGLENRIVYDFGDVLVGTCSVKQALIKDRRFPELYLVSAPQYQKKTAIKQENIQAFLEELKEDHDMVLIDAPAGIDENLLAVANAAKKAILVTVPEHAAIRDVELMNQMLQGAGVVQRCLAINKVKKSLYRTGLVPDPHEIAANLRLPVCGIVAYDENVHLSANVGIPIALNQDNYIAKNFNRIADRIWSNI